MGTPPEPPGLPPERHGDTVLPMVVPDSMAWPQLTLPRKGGRNMVDGQQARPVRFPERVSVKVPPGWRDKVDKAAEAADMSPAEWLRYTLRNALEASRQARERRAGGAS